MNGSGFGSLMDGLSGGYAKADSFKAKKAAEKPAMEPDAAKSAGAGSTAQGYGGDLSGFSAGKAGSTGAEAAAPKAESTAWSTLSGIVDSVSGMFKSKPALASGISQPATVGTEVAGLEGGL